jgi:GTPase SAR1 family protein
MGSRPLTHFETSAKTAVNVDEAFEELARLALQYEEYKKRTQPQLFVPPKTTPIDLRRSGSSMSERDDGCC